MTALVLVAVLVVAGFLVLRSRGGGGDVELTRAELDGALLTAADVGGGFVDQEPTDDGAITIDDVDADADCLDLWAELDAEGAIFVAVDPSNGAKAMLVDEGTGTQIDQELSSGSGVGLGRIREFFETCDVFDADLTDVTATVSFEIVDDLVEVGDDTITVMSTIDIAEPTAVSYESAYVVWARSGNQATVSISAIDADTGEPLPVDEATLTDAVEIADANLEAAIEDAG